MDTADVIRGLLIFTLLAQALVAVFYLRTRRLTWDEYLSWGLLTLLIPVLGPCLVIACRPGEPAVPTRRRAAPAAYPPGQQEEGRP